MKEIHFYFDVISPYAWLAFQALPKALEGISHRVHYHPVVFGAMLKHHGQLGPAEMPGKRDWTYRQVMWLAKQQGTDLQMPASHPFNSLALLRLAVAASRWRKLRRATHTSARPPTISSAIGQTTGRFHSACLRARNSGSTR